MLRFLKRATLVLAALSLLAIGGIAIYIWRLGDDTFSVAKAEGLFEPPPSDAPMTNFETAIQRAWFNRHWNERAPICSQIAGIWTAVTSGKPEPNEIAVVLANQIALNLPNPERTLESDLRRTSLSCVLEGTFSDVQMMRLYLRKALFNREIGGSEIASQAVFGKPTAALNAEESIQLAALFESRSIRDKPDEWAKRADYVRENWRQASTN